MKDAKPISKKITSIYLIGAATLLIFYSIAFSSAIHFTENQSSSQRLSMVAPFHFKQFADGDTGIIRIDPLINIYSDFELLPAVFQRRLQNDWQGNLSLHFEDDSEFSIFAMEMKTPYGQKIVYAIENIDAIELDDNSLIVFEIVFFVVGLLLFLITASFILKLAQRLGEPFESLAMQLKQDDGAQFSPIEIEGELSQELIQTLGGVNQYRKRINQSIEREQAFTRYISHEFRTPMTVIRGCLGILRRQADPKIVKQISQIDRAVTEMEQLTHTLLLLSREDDSDTPEIDITSEYLNQCISNLEKKIAANNVKFRTQLQQNFKLKAQPLLLQAVVQNISLNAINCSIDGQVNLFVSSQRIDVIDNGVGLDAKPRGYEGFGIGLNLVRDICRKYQWRFKLTNNREKGCTASIIFYD